MPEPLVNEPPKQDPFVDMLFDPRVGGVIFAAVIGVLAILVFLKRRRDRAREWEELARSETNGAN